MSAEESRYAEDWFRKGDADLRSAERLLEGEDIDIAAFHLQQAIEKYLKGYLIGKGWKLRRVHELEVLLNESVKLDKNLERFRQLCASATEYYLFERYPYDEPSSLTKEGLQRQLVQVKELREALGK